LVKIMLVLVIVFILTWRFLLLSFLKGRFIAKAQFSGRCT
jgi:hypothetical protein